MQTWTGPDPAAGQKFHQSVVTIVILMGCTWATARCLGRRRELGTPRVVMTFAPHPVQVLYPERGLRRLLPREDLSERLPEFGVDLLVEFCVHPRFRRAVGRRIPGPLRRRTVPPAGRRGGYDLPSAGGARGIGRLARLVRRPRDRPARVCHRWKFGGAVVSSRRLRALIEAGDVARRARAARSSVLPARTGWDRARAAGPRSASRR